MIQVVAFQREVTDTPGPAEAEYWLGDSVDGGMYARQTLVPVGFWLQITQDDGKAGGRLKGILRGWLPKDHDGKPLDVAGSFDAEICPRRCL